MRTYLDGVEQNSSPPYSTPSTGTDGYVYGYFAVEATQPFDAIEIQVSAANYNAMPFDFLIYEFCSDAGAR